MSGGMSVFLNLPGIVTPLFPSRRGDGGEVFESQDSKEEDGIRIEACMMWKAFLMVLILKPLNAETWNP